MVNDVIQLISKEKLINFREHILGKEARFILGYVKVKKCVMVVFWIKVKQCDLKIIYINISCLIPRGYDH